MTQTQHLGTPQRHGAGWFVPSGQVGYYVERLWDAQERRWRWRCACPSFRWGKTGTCKHIAAVRRLLANAVEA